ncbi:4-alpha-glucanotransferase [Planctomycetota bacterium]
MDNEQQSALEELAGLYGVELSYWDIYGKLQTPSREALLSVLRALGAPVDSDDDAQGAATAFRREQWSRLVEPVLVVWEGNLLSFDISMPDDLYDRVNECRLAISPKDGTEASDSLSVTIGLRDLPAAAMEEVAGRRYLAKRVTIPDALPLGYYDLAVEVGSLQGESLVIAAPARAPGACGRSWGAFLPLFALTSEHSQGIGDFSDLERLCAWIGEQGGRMVGTLPLLSAFLDEPFDISPYAPASRLFLNEIFVDLHAVPELAGSPEGQRLLESAEAKGELSRLRQTERVDYRRVIALKRRVLQELASSVKRSPEREAALARFVSERQPLQDYARFRAVGDRLRAPWQCWPEGLREGAIENGDVDRELSHYHTYVQWVAHEQLSSIGERAGASGVKLYLDLPLGVHPSSYDVYRERDAFVTGMSTGAPPDELFRGGQDWGFSPPHPQRSRSRHYHYLIASLRHHFRYAQILRVDHVMGLHRLYYVPHGLSAREGIYVRYPREELFAILCLEAHRANAVVVGEDLGTVPNVVRDEMTKRDIHRMYVAQFDVKPDPHHALGEAPERSLASLNTHDTPTFSGYWQGLDIDDRLDLGLYDEAAANQEREGREALKKALASFLCGHQGVPDEHSPEKVLRALLRHLAAQPAPYVLVNLEDLWLESSPQNVPGTCSERPNWLRRARHAFESFSKHPAVLEVFADLRRHRSE